MAQIGSRICNATLRDCSGPFDFPGITTRHHDYEEEEPTAGRFPRNQ
jgi:hypothetical protein